MGNNTHGFTNELSIRNYLNTKKFSELSCEYKSFIKSLYNKIIDTDIIYCEKVAGQSKEDCKIIINETSYNISIKTGSGNSVHQESVDTFCEFLKDNYNFTNDDVNCIKFYIWGDKTIDGTGKIEDRLSGSDIKSKYPKVITAINKIFSDIKDDLIYRFLFKGNISGQSINSILYTTETDIVWASKSEILNKFKTDNKNKNLNIYNLTFQAWNRNLSGDLNSSSEKKRGVIQLKWGSLEKDLRSIRGI